MPARGRGRRGGGRGGRGRGNAKASGRFRNNNSKKQKSKGTSNNHRKPPSDAPELMDLSQGVYIPEVGGPKSSMRFLSRRPERSMMAEALYTGAHMDETMRLPLRKRPIEFVKAKEVYDPNNELQRKFKEVTLEETEENKIEEPEGIMDGNVSSEENATDEEGEVSVQEDVIREKETSKQISSDDDEISEYSSQESSDTKGTTPKEVEFVIDEEGDASIDVSGIPKPKVSLLMPTVPKHTEASSALEHDSTLTIGKVTLQTMINEHGEMETELMAINSLNKVAKSGFFDETLLRFESDSDEEEEVDYDSDPMGYRDYINQIMKQMKDEDDYDSSEYESDTNFDIMASSGEEEEPEEIQEQEDHQTEENPEYGFLEEDYNFDVSKISISNVRLGLQNQYYTCCPDINGTSDSVWLDEEEITSYVSENGVKAHRLKSFFKFLTKDLITDEKDQPYYSDVYISESSEDEEDVPGEEDDNLDDLVWFTKTMSQNPHELDLEPTKSIQTKGKGKKKRFDLDTFEMDSDLRQTLQEQYLSQREAKRLRKQAKDDKRIEEGIANNDLFLKYPYTLHIKDIRDEMEEFLHDGTRNRLKFPPLDPHGNKTISKMGECFNFKSKRCGGNGLHQFMEVVKSKRTFQYIPDYNKVYGILKQRPVFNRIDQKRPKDEIIERDGNKLKDRKRARDKGSNANVREGDIVGEKAPEIDSNNVGRRLLEMMGWSKGQGLGAVGNQGINEPVLAKVKMSKLGLK
ncbi:squalene synthetase-like protein [Yamadazyma tenuis]|uniref:G-patch domain-containing protein n=1 Tax=Candida tenuis (strain ATCC 10573 / BCRC 21748 / CBS 615 / JCM 9827 / NBRC 10315 / NRRL Y-1498 / VKM Y-70) TaxID=590646 RepID=G3B7Y2_CANTC|nr:uncharacterized protein CANTEDRAFT_124678 [Yamadazyma tenuis ATCC 10573]EGV61685.1 hypothetical protein CANTEDRAFT_124678 [Yamadazyma tenuis ATCC 10573]WEJ92911.1 squalene synthetase-like protein [Yamadazyma tenuis]